MIAERTIALLLIGAVYSCIAASLNQNTQFVITGLKSTRGDAPLNRVRRSSGGRPTMTRFHVNSAVTSRYSRVIVTSVVENNDNSAKEAAIEMRLPKTAFISNFSMVIEGVTYVGIVRDKAAAKAAYSAAIARGESAGLVTAKIREAQTFDVSVNVAAGSSVTFTLEYQELLKRKLSRYHHVIYADPGQVVGDFKIEVEITEPTGLTTVTATPPSPKLRRTINPDTFDTGNVEIRRSETQAYVSYRPTREQQRNIRRRSDLSFLVNYDVTREELGGEILIKDGYFVHFFAPTNLPVIPKKVVFVIDVSGSMSGHKIVQTKEALRTILDDLNEIDQFNIITFSSTTNVWHPNEMVDVNPTNIRNAKKHVRSMYARGGTNFNAAALDGIQLLETISSNRTNTLEEASMMILLTDGQPTVGVTGNEAIRRNIRERVNGRYSIFCLGFGQHLDHEFLDQIASENKGLSRKIYNDADAALQLKDFYDEVASPLLAHVIMRYTGPDLDGLTKTTFDNFFDGSEILVTGRIQSSQVPQPLICIIGGSTAEGLVSIVSQGKHFEESFSHDWFNMEKIWAYLTIKEMLRNKSHVPDDDTTTHQNIKNEIVRLSLLYNFVTPMTSMVVTKPDEDVLASTVPPTINTPYPRPYPRRHHSFGRTLGRGRMAGPAAYPSRAVSNDMYLSAMRNLYLQPLLQASTTTTTTTAPATTTTTTTTSSPTTEVIPPPIPSDPFIQTYTCGSPLSLNSTVNITTPRYPGLYPSDIRCVWHINAISGNSFPISMEIQKLDTEAAPNCARDRILVYPDFGEPSSSETLQFCGYSHTRTILQAQQNFVVVFESDDLVQGRGFLATFALVR
nr:inter-alpha-trypsin inhibitor heavy chain H4 isoform X2 [Ciona intestinalis]|eukprot:XP_018667021.1 inter-alpha-trypsin inhibitor heavy chain H4 isoform X2 [Ciona intestinalis]